MHSTTDLWKSIAIPFKLHYLGCLLSRVMKWQKIGRKQQQMGGGGARPRMSIIQKSMFNKPNKHHSDCNEWWRWYFIYKFIENQRCHRVACLDFIQCQTEWMFSINIAWLIGIRNLFGESCRTIHSLAAWMIVALTPKHNAIIYSKYTYISFSKPLINTTNAFRLALSNSALLLFVHCSAHFAFRLLSAERWRMKKK